MQILNENGQRVFNARYALLDQNGKVIETFEQAVRRIAKAAASIESDMKGWESTFASCIGEMLFVPSTPIWANIGKPDRPWQPAACFVLAVEDSLESMYQTLSQTAFVFKSGGGVGYNFSPIRPKGEIVMTTKGKASGVVELIKLYDASSNMVMQGGVRRGASIGILNIDHPEIESFIEAKMNGGLENFNLSVGITDAFMEALENGSNWQLTFNGKVFKELPAHEIWGKIINAAHACGDPGVVFIDTIQKHNPVPSRVINACNPCGEIPLSPGESCLLASMNLAKMMDGSELNKGFLEEVTAVAVRFLDNLIDIAQYPLESIAESTRATRKIGLNYTGLQDALIMAGLPYDSPKGREFAAFITKTMSEKAHAVSESLAEEKGCFPEWKKSTFYPGTKRRNATCITMAPTGSVTTLAGCEGYGIEPLFAVSYKKKTNVAGEFDVFSPLFLEACRKAGVSDSVLSEVAKKGSCQNIEGIPDSIARLFKGAQEIDPQDHIKMQAAVQAYVDNSVSKTINLPNSATPADIGVCYRTAYNLGLKGITIFRDGSKKGAVTVGEQKEEVKGKLRRGDILPRPSSAQGTTHRIDTGCGKIYLTINYSDSGEILETFITTGSDGGCLVYTEAASRLISLAIRGGISLDKIIEQLEGTHSCPSFMMAKGKGKKLSPGKSCASAIAKKLSEVKAQINGKNKNHTEEGLKCPDCGENLIRAEGCLVCHCGYSKCG
ncbi:adenosylcobalamin-dependent ribonucleoside-diphosphate reductase [Pelotomaculum propionicicum]|uniref:adenosylcobalamin-dependent ribonucleoside-diphosphate reductase n=1 Tax=Pelotomaculum propionicicum TaxID=258475 RepID=UPI003B78163B